MEIATLFLFGCVLAKLVAIVNAIRWLAKHGIEYRKLIERLDNTGGPLRPQDFDAASASFRGHFFPYGLKEYKLRETISRLQNGPRFHRIVAIFLALYYRLLVQYHYLAFLTTSYLIILPGAHALLTERALTSFHAGLGYTLSLLLVAMNIAIEIEAILGYAMLGNYGRYFHMLTTRRLRLAAGSPFLVEIGIAAAISLVMLVSGAGACYVAYILFEGFGGTGLLAYDAHEPFNWAAVYLQCVYFALTTLTTVGYGDIAPRNGFGQLTTSLLLVQNFIFLVIVVSTIFSAVRASPPTLPEQREQ